MSTLLLKDSNFLKTNLHVAELYTLLRDHQGASGGGYSVASIRILATRDTTAEVNTSFSEDLAGPYLLVWDLSSRTGTVELRFTEVITLEVNLAKTLL